MLHLLLFLLQLLVFFFPLVLISHLHIFLIILLFLLFVVFRVSSSFSFSSFSSITCFSSFSPVSSPPLPFFHHLYPPSSSSVLLPKIHTQTIQSLFMKPTFSSQSTISTVHTRFYLWMCIHVFRKFVASFSPSSYAEKMRISTQYSILNCSPG